MASTPRCGREPCAARPVTSTSAQAKPLCATTTSSAVGSVTTAASARTRRQRLLHADAGVLLVGHRGHHHVAGQAAPRHLAAGHQRGGQPGLHVVRPAPVEAVAVHPRFVRGVGHALHAHRVQVAAQQQGPPAAGAGSPHQHAGPPGRGAQLGGLQAGVARPAGHERGDLLLARTAGHELRVHRVDGHQPRGQVGDPVAHQRGSSASARYSSRAAASPHSSERSAKDSSGAWMASSGRPKPPTITG